MAGAGEGQRQRSANRNRLQSQTQPHPELAGRLTTSRKPETASATKLSGKAMKSRQVFPVTTEFDVRAQV
jgi:hypothetical protein